MLKRYSSTKPGAATTQSTTQKLLLDIRLLLQSENGRDALDRQARITFAAETNKILETTVQRTSTKSNLRAKLAVPPQLELHIGDGEMMITSAVAMVTHIGDSSPLLEAQPAPLAVGDAILSVNGKEFTRLEEFSQFLAESAVVTLLIIRRFDHFPVEPSIRRACHQTLLDRVVEEINKEAEAQQKKTMQEEKE